MKQNVGLKQLRSQNIGGKMRKETLAEIIQEKNEQRARAYKEEAKSVVIEILDCQEKIIKYQSRIIELKAKLKDLEEPKPLTMEL